MVLHPDFNVANGHHSNVEFKPVIARYDWDQTYDILEFVYLPINFRILQHECGIPAYELMAIDRFTPYNYLWADQYSDKLFDFLKAFNFSPHSIYRVVDYWLVSESQNYIKDENDNYITIPKITYSFDVYNSINNFEDKYEATFIEGEYIITGLVTQFWQEGLISSITTINQVFYRFKVNNSKVIDLHKIIKKWLWDDKDNFYPSSFCACSIVISRKNNDGNWVEYTPSFKNKPNFLLYSDIDSYFNNVKQAIINYESSVSNTYTQTAFSVSYSQYGWMYSIKTGQNNELLIPNVPPTQGYLKKITTKVLDDDGYVNLEDNDITFEWAKFPSYMTDYCYLQRANNDKWKTGTIYSDKGIEPPVAIDITNLRDTLRWKQIQKVYPDKEEWRKNRRYYYDNETEWHTNPAYFIHTKKYDYYQRTDEELNEFYFKPLDHFLLDYGGSDNDIIDYFEGLQVWIDDPNQPPPISKLAPFNWRLLFNDFGGAICGLFGYQVWRITYDGNLNVMSRLLGEYISSPFTSLKDVSRLETHRTKWYNKTFNSSLYTDRANCWIHRGTKPFELGYARKVINEVKGYMVKGKFEWGYFDKVDNFMDHLELIGGGSKTGIIDYEVRENSLFTIDSDDTVSTEVILLTEAEFYQYKNYGAMTDQVYLDYLLQLKEQYEEDSKTW